MSMIIPYFSYLVNDLDQETSHLDSETLSGYATSLQKPLPVEAWIVLSQ